MNETKATRYHRWRRRVESAGAGAAVLTLALVALTPASGWLAGLADGFTAGWDNPLRSVVSLGVYVLLLALLVELAALPAALYVALRVDPAYTQRRLRPHEAVAGHAMAAALALPAAMAGALMLRLAVVLTGEWWWVLAALLLAAALGGALRLAPGLLARLGAARPLPRPRLAARLAALADRAGLPIAAIEEWRIAEPGASAAVVTGVGRSRRVLVASDIVRDWTDDEIAVVVAHELAHHVHGDLGRSWALNAGALAVGLLAADRVLALTEGALWHSGPADLASLPLTALAAVAVWAAATPARHALSRRQERRADAFALAMTGDAEAFGAAVRRLGAQRLAEERPSGLTRWLFFSHPPTAERLAFAEAWQRQVPAPHASRRPARR
jgi:STE24 endopeptidase